MKKLLLLIACVAMFVGCGTTLNEVIPIPVSFSPSYSLIETVDISTNNAPMTRAKITLPMGLSESDIINNLRYFVISSHAETSIRNITVFAYNSSAEANGSYTIAMYEFCPFGDWNRTNETVTNDKYKENYNINQSYFKQNDKGNTIEIENIKKSKITSEVDRATIKKTSQPSKGDKVALATDTEWNRGKQEFVPAKTTKLSDSPTDFSDERVVKIKNGTKATITDIYSQTITGGSKWIAYKVKLNNGKTGWVLAEDVVEVK